MRLLGLDPGLQRTGWGIIEADGNRLRFRAAGVVVSDAGDRLATRLDALYRGLQEVVAAASARCRGGRGDRRQRQCAAPRSSWARRAASRCSRRRMPGCRSTEYASKTVKRSVVGTGAATSARSR